MRFIKVKNNKIFLWGNKMSKNKRARRELALKKEKQKKIIITTVIAVVILAVAVIFIIVAANARNDEIYTDGSATITLLGNKNFTAVLYHNSQYSGTYVKSDDGGTVTFTYDGKTAVAELENNELHIPPEWEDGHGHGSGVLTLKK